LKKIQFTVFNGGQEFFEFDPNHLGEGEELDKFIVSKDDDGKIFIVPMIKNKQGFRRPLEILEKIKKIE
jgi:hypothetical protein